MSLKGVISATSGYAQGKTANPTYEQVCSQTTGYNEVVTITYDETMINLNQILGHLFRIIDPTTLNRQGNDIGDNYRSGIY